MLKATPTDYHVYYKRAAGREFFGFVTGEAMEVEAVEVDVLDLAGYDYRYERQVCSTQLRISVRKGGK